MILLSDLDVHSRFRCNFVFKCTPPTSIAVSIVDTGKTGSMQVIKLAICRHFCIGDGVFSTDQRFLDITERLLVNIKMHLDTRRYNVFLLFYLIIITLILCYKQSKLVKTWLVV